MAADAGVGLQDAHTRVRVGEFDEFPDVDVESVEDHRQLVCEGDVDVPIGVLSQLRHLCNASVGHEELALIELKLAPGQRPDATFNFR